MSNYSAYHEHIISLASPSFREIRRVAINFLNRLSQEKRDELYRNLNHGVNLLNTCELMCQYLNAYGNMHEAKIRAALKNIPKSAYSDDFAVIDWGCGQGLATVCFFDFLKEQKIENKNQKVILIEPSPQALERAKLHVNAYLQDESKIITVNKNLDDVVQDEIYTGQPVTFHFFSNILDIPTIDLKKLAQLVGKESTGEHYFCCVGPLNDGYRRIDAFYNYFNSPYVLDEKEESQNMLQIIAEDEHQKDIERNYTQKLKVFKFERDLDYYIPIEYYPAVQFHAAYQLDSVKNALKRLASETEKIKKIYNYLSDFEVSAPFDIGASVYDDVHPVLAVLNNIVVRGLPTKASPFVEEKFKDFGNKQAQDDLGAIVFDIQDINHDDLFLALHLIDPRWELTKENYNLKVLGSELENEYIINVAPKILQQILEPQRSLRSITDEKGHYAKRVDFACEFPYSNNSLKGCVVELDGAAYHTNQEVDRLRDNEINFCKWNCLRIPDTQIDNVRYQQFKNDYIENVRKAYHHKFTEDWIKTLQLVLSPVGIARVQKMVLEALMTKHLDIEQDEWKILAIERDVPCVALAFEDLRQMFEKLVALSKDYENMKFPKINLEIINTNEFTGSSLHLGIKPQTKATTRQKEKRYDMVIDIAILRRTGIENISFSEFKCENNCYFNIRSSHYNRSKRHIYTSDTIQYKPLVNKDKQGKFIDLQNEKGILEYFLKLLFRKKEFRAGQLPILSRALQNKCVIGLLPTGGGKSLTYQLAAMLQPGVTIVVDPLRSLMKDQYDGLIRDGIDTCAYINSTLTAQEKDEREKQMESSQMHFIFLSPERLCIYKFRERLKTMHNMNVYFAYGVIDEVHCVSEWGHDFRFSYLHLGRNLYNYVRTKDINKPLTLFGLTATASFDVLADVERELSGNGAYQLDSDTIVSENTNRLELQYKIEKVPVEYDIDKYYDQYNKLDATLPKAVNIGDKWAIYKSKNTFLSNYIPTIPASINSLLTDSNIKTIETNFNSYSPKQVTVNLEELNTDFSNDFYTKQEKYKQAGIIFCPHKDKTGISVNINAASLNLFIHQIGTFMGSSNEEDNNSDDSTDKISFENLELFRDNKLPLMVATKAFGMGIDKPNVRFTINMNYSSSIESFVQEAGRAGRDRKMAIAIILVSDYKLIRINRNYPVNHFPMSIIKNKWFKENDLLEILMHYKLDVETKYLDYLTPAHDLVKLKCEICNRRFAFNNCENTCNICNQGPCTGRCTHFVQCELRKIPSEAKGYHYMKDLQEILHQNKLPVPVKNMEYQNADYETVMYFYDINFKGSLIETQTMRHILNKSTTRIFYGDDIEIKETRTVSDFLNTLLNSETNTEIVAYISYKTVALYENKEVIVKSDIAKAIYRMCCIGLIDDFTEDYVMNCYRIVTVRKNNGKYYEGLQFFLERYYSKERAAEEIKKVPKRSEDNEVHKCLGYLTEFIYEKIAVKRKRAIDQIRNFCIKGIDDKKDWKEINEELKEDIYYYFNSKYARSPYETENGEPFSLTDDTEGGKNSSFEILFKYLRVVDDDVYGAGSAPKDSVKHLQGAVKLIRRSLTDKNAALSMLNTFCLAYLGTNDNDILEQELEESFKEGYMEFYDRNNNKIQFYNEMKKMFNRFQEIHIDETIINKMNKWRLHCELLIHNNWVNNFKNLYTKNIQDGYK